MTGKTPPTSLVVACALQLALCGACSSRGTERTATAREQDARPAVTMTLTLASGGAVSLEELRGQPLLLFVFSTYDLGSQAALTPLLDFHERHPDVRILGIAAQPDAQRLLPHFAKALSVPFPLAFHPDSAIRSGESALGELQAVPTFVVLDARGRIAGRRVGYAKVSELESLLQRARAGSR